jgi:diadenosine tetraphosphate (Ap4A) HIT family hydrolase
METFALHPRLAADTAFIADWPLSRVLLMNDARFPWLVLVPRREGAIELHDLAAPERALLVEEIARASAALKQFTGAAKINVGALGNIVSQLHAHVVARKPGDAAWPGPVWGSGTPIPYDPVAKDAFIQGLATRLA